MFQRVTRHDVLAEEAAQALSAVDGVLHVQRQPGEEVHFLVEGVAGSDPREAIFRLTVARGWTLLELARTAATLEDIFRQLTAGAETGASS